MSRPDQRPWARIQRARDARDAGVLGGILEEDLHPGYTIVALKALGEVGGPDALERITSHLARDSRPSVQSGGMEALGVLGDPRAVPVLAQTLADGPQTARYGAAIALGKVGGPAAVDALRVGIEWNTDSRVRRRIAEAFARIRTDEAVEALEALLDDRSRLVRGMIPAYLYAAGTVAAADALERQAPRMSRLERRRAIRRARKIRELRSADECRDSPTPAR